MRRRTEPKATQVEVDGNEDWGMPTQETKESIDRTVDAMFKPQIAIGLSPAVRVEPEKRFSADEHTQPVPQERNGSDPLDALCDGDELTYCCGKELFTPVKYNAVEIGPFTVKVSVKEGESGRQAAERARAAVNALWEAEFAKRLPLHIQRAKVGCQ